MRLRVKIRVMLLAAALLVMLLCMATGAQGQCAMCRAAVNAATNGANLAKSFNTAVLVLLAPPVTIFCSIFIVAYKHRQARKEDEDEEQPGAQAEDEPDDGR